MAATHLITDTVRAHMDAWTATDAPGIDRDLVHKQRDDNVVLERVGTLPGGRFLAQVRVDQAHPFFFDHPLDHVPGMLLVEAARQFGIAVAHQHFGVEMDAVFSLSGFDVSFDRYAELDAPTFILGQVADPVHRGGALRRMRFSGGFVQRDATLGQMTGTWRMASPAVWARVRRRRG